MKQLVRNIYKLRGAIVKMNLSFILILLATQLFARPSFAEFETLLKCDYIPIKGFVQFRVEYDKDRHQWQTVEVYENDERISSSGVRKKFDPSQHVYHLGILEKEELELKEFEAMQLPECSDGYTVSLIETQNLNTGKPQKGSLNWSLSISPRVEYHKANHLRCQSQSIDIKTLCSAQN